MKDFDLTVITVCRNAADIIGSCIDSVAPLLHHPHLKVEHLIIDGASTDATTALLSNELKKGRISRYISEPDAGIYDAMNKGIAQARGVACVFINADDEICSEAVESCCRPILSGDVDYTVSSVRVLNENKQFIHLSHPNFKTPWFASPYCHQGMFCRTELLRQQGGFSLEYQAAADCALMWALYEKQYPYSTINVVSANFISGGASAQSIAYEEHLRILLSYSQNVLQTANKNSSYRSCILKQICSYLGTILRDSLKITPTITNVAILHRELVSTLSLRKRHLLRLTYLFRSLRNRLTALLSQKRQNARLARARLYSYLSEYC